MNIPAKISNDLALFESDSQAGYKKAARRVRRFINQLPKPMFRVEFRLPGHKPYTIYGVTGFDTTDRKTTWFFFDSDEFHDGCGFIDGVIEITEVAVTILGCEHNNIDDRLIKLFQ